MSKAKLYISLKEHTVKKTIRKCVTHTHIHTYIKYINCSQKQKQHMQFEDHFLYQPKNQSHKNKNTKNMNIKSKMNAKQNLSV